MDKYLYKTFTHYNSVPSALHMTFLSYMQVGDNALPLNDGSFWISKLLVHIECTTAQNFKLCLSLAGGFDVEVDFTTTEVLELKIHVIGSFPRGSVT